MKKSELSRVSYLRTILEAFPTPVLIVDRDLEIVDSNKASKDYFNTERDLSLRQLCGDLLNCINAVGGGCGKSEHCAHCVLRKIASSIERDEKIFRVMSETTMLNNNIPERHNFLVSGSLFEYDGRELVLLTLEDITEVIKLREILPLCSHCKKIRNDEEYWEHVEDYLRKYKGIMVSHGICPECMHKHYPGISVDQNE